MILAPIKTVGVIGAGPMGNGIAQCFATAGYEVTLNDISKDALDRAAATIEKNLYRMVARSKVGPEEMECSLQNISLTNEIDSVGGCDLVIEAATENEEVKSQIFDALGQSLEPHTILATNTSSISMTRLAAARIDQRNSWGCTL